MAMLRPTTRVRDELPDKFKWSLESIFPSWDAWQQAYEDLELKIGEFAAFQGTLAQGAPRLLAAFRLSDELGQLAYKVWYYPSLRHDEDQRDNEITARRQQVQILFAQWKEATAWFNPELLRIPLGTVRQWMNENGDLALYRFAIEDLYRQQDHVLDEAGERLMSFASRFDSAPHDTYAALSTADIRYPTITLSSGAQVVLTYGTYRQILATDREQSDRAKAFHAFHETFGANLNTYAALYNATCQRDWFHAQARRYGSTLEAALFRNNIPPSVVETLIAVTQDGTEPLRRYHRLRKRALGLERYCVYDATIPVLQADRQYPYGDVIDWIVESVAPLGADYQDRLRCAFEGRWLDVYENEGKRSGAYSAPVYGVHPYMLLNYNDTLDAVYTLAHEMGHSMHTLLSHERQPFVYSDYTIFVAEVPSTLSEALLLEYMLARTDDPRDRIVLLQHAIDGIAGTFYTQVLFADFELQAHRLAEQGRPITAAVLNDLYGGLLERYYADTFTAEPLAQTTWARIPHFYGSPYYVYQYATCFASAAKLVREITGGPASAREAALDRYLTLLRSGGNDHPMEQLRAAGVDLRQRETVRAVVDQLEDLVTRLEAELSRIGTLQPATTYP